MRLTTVPILLTLTSLVPYALTTPGYPADALRNTFQGVINRPGFKNAVGSILHFQDETEKAALEKRSPKTRHTNPLPVSLLPLIKSPSTHSHADFPAIRISMKSYVPSSAGGCTQQEAKTRKQNPNGENPIGTKPCGTYATTATDGPCGAWFIAQHSITPAVQTPTTLVTMRTTTVTLDFPQKTA
ncbi:MAG: hypothetical protein LQ337_002619 [Flavoplaca oasis]|nr:MAG: hypothetical protein LQ337_002619 [Flavoplaca oasis]